MSRLESFRRRLTAQIDGLNWALAQTSSVPGDVIELGLGNGRSYDHLRKGTDKRIWVVDRVLQCHPSCVPPEADFLQGDADTALQTLGGKGIKAALVHSDLGNGDDDRSVRLGARLSPLIAAVLAPGGLAVSQEPLVGLTRVEGPATVIGDRYFFYRMDGESG